MLDNSPALIGFRTLLKETCDHHGWAIPPQLVNYTVQILADKIDKNPWQPEPSYAERYMSLRTAQEALELGNTCWFTRAVFPELLERRGLKSSYFVDMGQGCYQRFLHSYNNPTVELLNTHFEFTAEVAHTAVRLCGYTREMWDL
jgi:hypothetical protein